MAFSHSPTLLLRPARPLPRVCFTSLGRQYTSPPSYNSDAIAKILEKPTWSVRSLLPADNAVPSSEAVTPEKLRHLLRLSALPQPANEREQKTMLRTLESQIHFVKEVQRVDTAGITPLRAIRDESPEATKESSIGLDDLKEALSKERSIGRSKKIQRVQSEKNTSPDGDAWDGNALGSASRTMGKYFYVDLGN